MSVAIIRGLLLGGLGWILWDKLGIMGLAAMPLAVLFLLFWNQDSLLYVPRKGEYTQRPHQVKPLDNYEELTLVGMDGTKITAWLIKQHARGSDARSYTTSPTIIFLVRDHHLSAASQAKPSQAFQSRATTLSSRSLAARERRADGRQISQHPRAVCVHRLQRVDGRVPWLRHVDRRAL